MKTKFHLIEHLSGKLIACLLVAAFLVVGAIGLILPIIPGLLFLAFAALIAGRYFPATKSWLRRNGTIGRHLDRADGILDLSLWDQLRFGGLLCAKMLIEGAAFVVSLFPLRRRSVGR